jgi:hypothetical protein
MFKALTIILLVSLVVSQQVEEADIQVISEAKPLSPAHRGPRVSLR